MVFQTTLREFLRDESSGTSTQSLTLGLVIIGGVWALTHGLLRPENHRLGGLNLSLAALPLAAGVRTRKGRGWEWECGGEVILAERNVARDRRLGQVPRAEEMVKRSAAVMHTGERHSAISWEWPGDGRKFYAPAELLEIGALDAGGMALTRDVILVAGHLYRVQGQPERRIVETSYRQLFELLGLEWAGSKSVEELEEALTLARFLTIRNYPVIKLGKHGVVMSRDVFGFLERVSRIEIRDGKHIPRNKQPLQITISELYAEMIRSFAPAPVPVAALEAAHRAPRRLRTPAKSMAYYLASRVPLRYVKLTLTLLAEIMGYRSRRADKLLVACDRTIELLYPVMVRDYKREGHIYAITLAGKPGTPPYDTQKLGDGR